MANPTTRERTPLRGYEVGFRYDTTPHGRGRSWIHCRWTLFAYDAADAVTQVRVMKAHEYGQSVEITKVEPCPPPDDAYVDHGAK